jgi:hypothetical protein
MNFVYKKINKKIPVYILLLTTCFVQSIIAKSQQGAFKKFTANQKNSTEVWRITNDPTMRDWANYHNTDAWSPDGRFICWEHWAWLTKPDYSTDRGKDSQVYIFDIKTKQQKLVGNGSQPRWATNHNWLFFVQEGSNVIWYNADTGQTKKLTTGVMHIGETDFKDRWLYGSTVRLKKRGPRGSIVRISLEENAKPELLEDARGVFYLPNPAHPKVLFRVDGLLPPSDRKPFAPLHIMTDMQGRNEQILSPELRHGHQTWSGDGKWFLMGNGQMRGRKWNEPFPSNSHYLANISCGDISPCGRSGRWIVGGNNIGSLQIADLRSGHGKVYLRALSFVHYYGAWHANSMGDCDSKGSPDGTKIVFVTNYDLENAPHTKIAQDMPAPDADRIIVDSTEGFPESGRLSIQAEIIGYKRKTSNSFEDLEREMYGVRAENPGTLSYFPPDLFNHYTENRLQLTKGLIVTSFEDRLIPEEKRKDMIVPDKSKLPENWNQNPVTWQRRSDVHVAVVRKPDRPFIRYAPLGEEEVLQLIPGQNHWEIEGYEIYKDGKILNKELLIKPGQTIDLGYHATGQAHLYIQAVAVEWSGLRSEKSITVMPTGRPTLKVLSKKPEDFEWEYNKYLVNGREVSKKRAFEKGNYIKETLHIYNGPVSRKWYDKDILTKQYDLNDSGYPTRRLFFKMGKLYLRQYWKPDDIIISEEFFDKKGYIYETKSWAYDLYLNDMFLNEPYLENHWFYNKAMPVKMVGSESYERFTSFPGVYIKQDDTWIKVKEIPTPPVKVK